MHHRAETGKADWTKYDRTWNHRLLYFQSSGALCAELRLEWLLPPSGHKVAAELTYTIKENRVRTMLSSEVQPVSTTFDKIRTTGQNETFALYGTQRTLRHGRAHPLLHRR